MISAYFAGSALGWAFRARLGFAAISVFVAPHWRGGDTSTPVEAALLAIIALTAAATGFPVGVGVALMAAIADYVARTRARQRRLVPALLTLDLRCRVSALFFGRVAPIEEVGELQPGQLVFRAAARALPRGERLNGDADSTSIAALAAGVREVAEGDFTKNLAVRRGASELASRSTS